MWENDLIWDWGISVSVPHCPNLFSLSMCVWKKIPIGPGLVVLNFFNRLQLRLESRLSTCISLLVQFLHAVATFPQINDKCVIPPYKKMTPDSRSVNGFVYNGSCFCIGCYIQIMVNLFWDDKTLPGENSVQASEAKTIVSGLWCCLETPSG